MLRSLSVFFTMLIVALTAGCPMKPDPPPVSGGGTTPVPATDRKPAVPANHPLYARVEAPSYKNDCTGDSACVKTGCSREICSAETGLGSTCEAVEKPFPADALCGCVAGQCVWYVGGTSAGVNRSD